MRLTEVVDVAGQLALQELAGVGAADGEDASWDRGLKKAESAMGLRGG